MFDEALSREPLRILIVDDEMSLRYLLEEVMTDDGYSVTTAANGEEALRLFHEQSFPLVITDIRMPGIDGIELLQRIRQDNEDTQVIIITSHASLDSAVTALRAGAYDYLIKPFEDLDLISAIVKRAFEKIRLVIENRDLLEKLRIKNQELKTANSVLQEMAIRDGLTNLYNHRHFQESLVLEVARSTRYDHEFSIIFLDVDYFKHFNDTHGHPKGDAVLETIGDILQTRLRNTDLACRYGGEEFVLLLTETTRQGAAMLAEGIRSQIEQHFFEGEETQPEGQLTVSIGVASYPTDGGDASTLLKNADQALYRSKEKGRNCVTIA